MSPAMTLKTSLYAAEDISNLKTIMRLNGTQNSCALQTQTSPATSEFEQELSDYLKALRLPAASAHKAEALCKQHDFSSARVHLIISRPGYHSGTHYPNTACCTNITLLCQRSLSPLLTVIGLTTDNGAACALYLMVFCIGL